MPILAVYAIICLATGRRYIGSSIDVSRRWKEHQYYLRNKRHHCAHLQHAWDKYGPASFSFAILETVHASADLRSAEQKFLDAESSPLNSKRLVIWGGVLKHAPASKEKISAAGRRRVVKPETRLKISAALKGVPKSPEHAAKVGAAQRGKKLSPEHRAQLIQRLHARAEIMRGVPLPKEWREAIARGQRGKTQSDEHRRNRGRSMAMWSPEEASVVKTLVSAGVSQHSVAKQCGVNQSTISRLVRGKRLTYGGSVAVRQ